MLSLVNCSWTHSQMSCWLNIKFRGFSMIYPSYALVFQHTPVECLKYLECLALRGNKDKNIDVVPLNMPIRGFLFCDDVAVSTKTWSEFWFDIFKHQTCFSQTLLTTRNKSSDLPPFPCCSLNQIRLSYKASQSLCRHACLFKHRLTHLRV